MKQTIRVLQLSDTHFLEPGSVPEGGFSYDTAEAFDAVLGHCDAGTAADLVVITGDVADHGRAEQYGFAADAFSRFDAPVNVCPGNHDLHDPFTAAMGRPSIGTSRVIEVGAWCFLFVDSNSGVMGTKASGRRVDPASSEDRLHANGALGESERTWIRDMCALTRCEHVFVWLHHPPSPGIPLSHDDDYAEEWASLLGGLPKIRGLGGGHTHVPTAYEYEGCPVFVAPSLKHCFDLDKLTWLPPGYRSYAFSADGGVSSELHLLDGELWPRRPMGRALQALFNGELSAEELAEIAARRQRRPD